MNNIYDGSHCPACSSHDVTDLGKQDAKDLGPTAACEHCGSTWVVVTETYHRYVNLIKGPLLGKEPQIKIIEVKVRRPGQKDGELPESKTVLVPVRTDPHSKDVVLTEEACAIIEITKAQMFRAAGMSEKIPGDVHKLMIVAERGSNGEHSTA